MTPYGNHPTDTAGLWAREAPSLRVRPAQDLLHAPAEFEHELGAESWTLRVVVVLDFLEFLLGRIEGSDGSFVPPAEQPLDHFIHRLETDLAALVCRDAILDFASPGLVDVGFALVFRAQPKPFGQLLPLLRIKRHGRGEQFVFGHRHVVDLSPTF